MLGAPVAAHAVCAPFVAGGVATVVEQPFGLGAVAGGGYNPPQRLSDIYRKREDEPSVEEQAVEVVELVEDEPVEIVNPFSFDVQAFWDQYQAQQAAEAERLAQARTLQSALNYDEGEIVLRLWNDEEMQMRQILDRIIQAAAKMVDADGD